MRRWAQLVEEEMARVALPGAGDENIDDEAYARAIYLARERFFAEFPDPVPAAVDMEHSQRSGNTGHQHQVDNKKDVILRRAVYTHHTQAPGTFAGQDYDGEDYQPPAPARKNKGKAKARAKLVAKPKSRCKR